MRRLRFGAGHPPDSGWYDEGNIDVFRKRLREAVRSIAAEGGRVNWSTLSRKMGEDRRTIQKYAKDPRYGIDIEEMKREAGAELWKR
jgi:hypothetical protein